MEIISLDPISPSLLIAMGIILIAVEALLYSFTIFWFGVSAIIIGSLSFIINFNNALWQIGSVGVLALMLLFILRNKLIKKFMSAKGKDYEDDYFTESGEGIIKNGKVYYKATYWNIKSDHNFDENESVKIIEIKENIAYIEKLKK